MLKFEQMNLEEVCTILSYSSLFSYIVIILDLIPNELIHITLNWQDVALEPVDEVTNYLKSWNSRRTNILNKYTTGEKLTIVSSFLPGGEKSKLVVLNSPIIEPQFIHKYLTILYIQFFFRSFRSTMRVPTINHLLTHRCTPKVLNFVNSFLGHLSLLKESILQFSSKTSGFGCALYGQAVLKIYIIMYIYLQYYLET